VRGLCGSGIAVLVFKFPGTNGGALGLRGRRHVRVSMPTVVEGTVEVASDVRVVDALEITVALAFDDETVQLLGLVEEGGRGLVVGMGV